MARNSQTGRWSPHHSGSHATTQHGDPSTAVWKHPVSHPSASHPSRTRNESHSSKPPSPGSPQITALLPNRSPHHQDLSIIPVPQADDSHTTSHAPPASPHAMDNHSPLPSTPASIPHPAQALSHEPDSDASTPGTNAPNPYNDTQNPPAAHSHIRKNPAT